jgi:hypothetical protein
VGFALADRPVERVVDVTGRVGERAGGVLGVGGEAVLVVVAVVLEQGAVAAGGAACLRPARAGGAVEVAERVVQVLLRAAAAGLADQLLAAVAAADAAGALAGDVADRVEGERVGGAGACVLVAEPVAGVVAPAGGADAAAAGGGGIRAKQLERVAQLAAVVVDAVAEVAERVLLQQRVSAVRVGQLLQPAVVEVAPLALLLLRPGLRRPPRQDADGELAARRPLVRSGRRSANGLILRLSRELIRSRHR